MPFCTQCGLKNDDDAKFCNKCGQNLEQTDASFGKPVETSKTRMVAIVLLFLLASGGTYFHLKGADIRIAGKQGDAAAYKSPIGDEDGFIPDIRKGDFVPDIQKGASQIVDTVLGSDQEVDVSMTKPTSPPGGASDVERAGGYNYKISDCDNLFSDVIQHGAYSIQQEMLEVTRISVEEENEIGRAVAKNIEKQRGDQIDVDKEWAKYVRSLGERLASGVKRKGIDYHFHVIRDDMANAFAIPGGGIYVCTGILEKIRNEAQLAGIISHEIKHVDLRHCIALYQFLSNLPQAAQNTISFQMAQAARHPYSSRQEADADRRGLELAYSFGYSPYQIVKFWESDIDGTAPPPKQEEGLFGVIDRVGDEIGNVLSTHPKNQKRSCLLKNHIVKLQSKYPMETVYVGEWNYGNRITMFKKCR